MAPLTIPVDRIEQVAEASERTKTVTVKWRLSSHEDKMVTGSRLVEREDEYVLKLKGGMSHVIPKDDVIEIRGA